MNRNSTPPVSGSPYDYRVLQPGVSSSHYYRMLQERIRSLVLAITLIGVLVLLGTLGYALVEGWSILDSFYMTVITIGTVGFQEVHPLSPAGRLFTSGLIITGVGIAAYCFALITQAVVHGEFVHFQGVKRMRSRLRYISEHTIICGYGRLGRIVVRELEKRNQPVVVIDLHPEKLRSLESSKVLHVAGSAYDDEVLLAAGIRRAKTLLSLLPHDADNVYVTLCARDLNPDITIFARTEDEAGEKRLRRAGTTHVIAPYRIGGARIVEQLLRPNLLSFLEVAIGHSEETNLVMEEISVPQASPFTGKTLEEIQARGRLGVIIAAIIDMSGEMEFNPGAQSQIPEGSTLIVLGSRKAIDHLNLAMR